MCRIPELQGSDLYNQKTSESNCQETLQVRVVAFLYQGERGGVFLTRRDVVVLDGIVAYARNFVVHNGSIMTREQYCAEVTEESDRRMQRNETLLQGCAQRFQETDQRLQKANQQVHEWNQMQQQREQEHQETDALLNSQQELLQKQRAFLEESRKEEQQVREALAGQPSAGKDADGPSISALSTIVAKDDMPAIGVPQLTSADEVLVESKAICQERSKWGSFTVNLISRFVSLCNGICDFMINFIKGR